MLMASSQAWFTHCFECPNPRSRCSRSLTRSSLQNNIESRSIDCHKRRAAVASRYQALVSDPSDSFCLPNRFNDSADHLDGLHGTMLDEVSRLVQKVEKGSIESLVMVDSLKRLGIDHHFEEEIMTLLQEHRVGAYGGHPKSSSMNGLYKVALRFRLLRQEGYYVPADVFEAFKITDVNQGGYVFDKKLHRDVTGLMSLFEASHLAIEGEDILDEAAHFSRTALTSLPENNEFPYVDNDSNGMSSRTLREQVKKTLSNPFHKSLPRFTSEDSKVYAGGPYQWSKAFKELAILDSELISSVYRDEISQVSKWWNDLGLAKELKFARDQPLKWYMWPMAMLSHPRLSQDRVDLTKPIAMIYIVDDIYDVCGTLEELTLFTEAISRWECIEELPDYMKTCFRALDGITNEISLNFYKKHGWNPTDLLRKSWVSLCRAFLVEARWFTSCQSPSADEYLKNATVSSGVDLVMMHTAVLSSQCANQHTLCTLNGFSGATSAAAMILRLWDDLGSAEDENQDGRDGSYVEYYMKENPSCSLDGAREQVKEMISDAWKSLNREHLFGHPSYTSMVKTSFNLARLVPLMYDYDENHRLPRIEHYMKSLLLDRSTTA